MRGGYRWGRSKKVKGYRYARVFWNRNAYVEYMFNTLCNACHSFKHNHFWIFIYIHIHIPLALSSQCVDYECVGFMLIMLTFWPLGTIASTTLPWLLAEAPKKDVLLDDSFLLSKLCLLGSQDASDPGLLCIFEISTFTFTIHWLLGGGHTFNIFSIEIKLFLWDNQ